ncbi:MAG: class I tRNA ligase family protein, partial [Chitinophagaceae bacterium]|nr:class I tRNA ligase family protein [Chitinophagaceae bacterium]
WRLFFDEVKGKIWTNETPTPAELKILHRTIKKIQDDNERISFNTGVSTFMIAVNDLTDAGCHKKKILQDLLVLLHPYAPHITEELWHQLGNGSSITLASFPELDESMLIESSFNYPVAINGKKRTEIKIDLDISKEDLEKIVLEDSTVQKWLEGGSFERIIYRPRQMINVVVKK